MGNEPNIIFPVGVTLSVDSNEIKSLMEWVNKYHDDIPPTVSRFVNVILNNAMNELPNYCPRLEKE